MIEVGWRPPTPCVSRQTRLLVTYPLPAVTSLINVRLFIADPYLAVAHPHGLVIELPYRLSLVYESTYELPIDHNAERIILWKLNNQSLEMVGNEVPVSPNIIVGSLYVRN